MLAIRSVCPWMFLWLIGVVALTAACGMALPSLPGLDGGVGSLGDACALITKADAERILGQAVGNPAVSGDGACDYVSADETTNLNVIIESGEGTRQVFELTKLPFASQPGGLLQELPGLGDRAYLVLIGGDGSGNALAPVTILAVLKKDTMLTLIVGDPTALEPALQGPSRGSLAELKAVAQRVIDQV